MDKEISKLRDEIEKLRIERDIYRNGLRIIRSSGGEFLKIKNRHINKIRQRYAGFAEQILDKNSTFILSLDEFNNSI